MTMGRSGFGTKAASSLVLVAAATQNGTSASLPEIRDTSDRARGAPEADMISEDEVEVVVEVFEV